MEITPIIIFPENVGDVSELNIYLSPVGTFRV